MRIIGIAHSSFIAKDNGKQITGYQFYVSEPAADVQGEKTQKPLWISESTYGDFANLFGGAPEKMLGIDVKVEYNQWGKVQSLTPIGK